MVRSKWVVVIVAMCMLAAASMVAAEPAEMPLVLVAEGDWWGVTDLATDGHYLYATTVDGQTSAGSWYASLRVLDVSSPTAPVEIGRASCPMLPLGITISGPNAAVSLFYTSQPDGEDNYGFGHVDLSIPTDPQWAPGYWGAERSLLPSTFAMDGKLFAIVRQRTTGAPDPADVLVFPADGIGERAWTEDVCNGIVESVTAIGDNLWMMELRSSGGFLNAISLTEAYDLFPSEPAYPWVATTLSSTPARGGALAAKGTVLYAVSLGDWDGSSFPCALDVWNVGNPEAPSALASLDLGPVSGGKCGLAVSGDFLVASLGENGLSLLDISAPTAPALLAQYTPDGAEINDAVLIAPYIYACCTTLIGGDLAAASTEEPKPSDLVRFRALSAFPDMPLTHWAQDEVWRCSRAGVVNGYPDGNYQPAVAVDRGQMAVYVARALAGNEGSVPLFSGESTFSDVPGNFWALKHIEYAVAENVVGGYSDGTYQPAWLVDRGQMAVYVARARGWVGIADDMTTAPEVFPDVPGGYWAGTAVQACVENGVVRGYDDGYYYPANVVTRDQMAVYVARAFGL